MIQASHCPDLIPEGSDGTLVASLVGGNQLDCHWDAMVGMRAPPNLPHATLCNGLVQNKRSERY